MITLQNLGDSILFTFDENDKYLNNGTISVPMNSLILVTDDSDMATFRKSATNDIFVSALYSDFGMTKAELEQWYAENMVSEVTEEDVDEKIAEAVGEETDRAVSAETALSGAIDAVDAAYKAADSVISGAVDNLSTALQNESQRAVSAETALSGAIDAIDAAYKAADSVISGAVDNLSSALQNESQRAVSAETALSGAIDTKIDESAITSAITSASTDSEIPTAKAVYDALQESGLDEDTEKLISGSLNDLNERKLDVSAYTPTDLTNYYTKSETSGATEIATALNAKQDTLVSGTNIKTINNESLLGSGNIEIQGGGKAVSGGTNISITTGETADTINCTLPFEEENDSLLLGYNITLGTGQYYSLGISPKDSISSTQTIINGNYAIAIGSDVEISRGTSKGGDCSVAIGKSSKVYGIQSTALGVGCKASGNTTLAIGRYSVSNGDSSVAIGNQAKVSGDSSVAIGSGATVNGVDYKMNLNNQIKVTPSNQVYIYNKDNTEMICLQDQLGGGGVTVDPSLDSGSTNPVANSAITEAVIIDASNRDSITSNDYGGFKTFYATQVKSISFTKGYSSAYIEGYILLDNSATKYVFSGNTSSSTTLTDAVTLNLASKTASITVKDRNAHTIRELYMQVWHDNTKQDTSYIYDVNTVFNPPLGVNKAEFVNKCQHYGINVTNELISGGSSYTAGNGIDITNDVISVTGKVDTSAFTAHTADTTIHVTAADKTAWNNKQNAGNYWNLDTDPVRLTEATSIINENIQTSAIKIYGYDFDGSNSNDLYEFKYINGNPIFRYKYGSEVEVESYGNLSLVETSAITTSITSSSTDAQIPTAKAVNDKLGGLSLVKLTQAEYDALATKDSNVLYIIVG